MNGLKRLIHEMHRRSLWQVVTAYAVGSYVVLEVLAVLDANVGLPEWAGSMALVLLLLGLPMVVATALVQERVPDAQRFAEGSGERSTEQPAQEAGRASGSEPQVVTAVGPRDGPAIRSIFTWRNFLLGGAAAAALLVVSVAAYFALWRTDNLRAQGLIEEGEFVLLADFDSQTGDGALAAAVTEALRIDLAQSSAIRPLPDAYLAEVLRRMGRAPSDLVSPAVARDAAQREGLKAIIEGKVSAIGSGFVLTAAIVEPGSGEMMATFREDAGSEDEVLSALNQLSRAIREKAGESLRSIRQTEPLEAVTTGSLVALRRYTEAVQADERGEFATAIALFQDAVREDTAFAMAFRKLAAMHARPGEFNDPELSAGYAARAFESVDRLTEEERLLTVALYHSSRGENDQAIEAYEALLRIDPEHPTALNNLSILLRAVEEFERSAELLRRVVDGPAPIRVAYGNLVTASLFLGDLEGARHVLEQRDEREEPLPTYRVTWMTFHLNAGDVGAVHALLDSVLADPGALAISHRSALDRAARVDYRTGRMREAIEHWQAAAENAAEAGARDPELLYRLRVAIGTAQLDPDRGLQMMEEVWRQREAFLPGATRFGEIASWIYTLGGADRLPDLRAASERAASEHGGDHEIVRLGVEFYGALAEGDPQLLEDLARVREAAGCTQCLRWEEALAHRVLGNWSEAVRVLEDYLARPLHAVDGATFLPQLELWLAEAYDALGNATAAADHYEAFAALWADSDPELRPRVAEARSRAAELRAASG